MARLSQQGRFKAQPIMWGVSRRDDSKSVALVVEYKVIAAWSDEEWVDWTSYEDQTITAYHYIVKKDGGINKIQAKQLMQAGVFPGSFALTEGPPPNVVVQIVVAEEEYNGKTSLKVQWVNPEDYAPGPKTLPAGDLEIMDSQYGSQFRAMAAQNAPAKAAPPKTEEPPARTDEDLPF